MLKKELPFKLNIPAEVQKKIDLMCLQISNIEWSGSLFYSIEGSWKDNNLVVTILDFFPQDIGDTGSTSFEQSPDLVGYMVDHDLLTAYRGLIHSHHNMQAFFSGTDINTLKSEALDHNHFLSLVVNNRRNYVAAITSVIDVKRVKTIKEEVSFNTFDGVVEQLELKEFVEEEVVKEVIYSPLSIHIEEYENTNAELLARIQELRKMVKPKPNYYFGMGTLANQNNQKGGSEVFTASGSKFPFQNQQTLLFDEAGFGNTQENTNSFKEFMKQKEEESKENNLEIPAVTISPELIEYKVKQLVTLSRVIPRENKIDIHSFIKSMPSLYTNCFSDLGHYMSFISFYVEDIIIDSTVINDPNNQGIEEEILTFYLASEILMLLQEEAKDLTNPYYEKLVEELEGYLQG